MSNEPRFFRWMRAFHKVARLLLLLELRFRAEFHRGYTQGVQAGTNATADHMLAGLRAIYGTNRATETAPATTVMGPCPYCKGMVSLDGDIAKALRAAHDHGHADASDCWRAHCAAVHDHQFKPRQGQFAFYRNESPLVH